MGQLDLTDETCRPCKRLPPEDLAGPQTNLQGVNWEVTQDHPQFTVVKAR
jgi:hypothetical protein